MHPLELFIVAGILIGLFGICAATFATTLDAIKRGHFITGIICALHSSFWILGTCGVLWLITLGEFHP